MAARANAPGQEYARLLTEFRPAVVKTEGQNEKYLAEISRLMRQPDRSAEESALLELLAVLVENFEKQKYRLKRATPSDILRELMRAHAKKPADLYTVFGSKGTTSEILRGKRGISKHKAKVLAEMFHVSAELFL